MPRPVVGICAGLERARWGPWDDVASLNPLAYARAVQAAGALAVQLPPDDHAEDEPEPWLELLDGLLVPGGDDIDPAAYGAEPHPKTYAGFPERDRFELALCRAAVERDLPVLGICRGFELLNVALGGTLEQHLPDRLDGDLHRQVPGTFQGEHDVRLEPGSLAARAAGAERITVKSHHHQGADCLGEGLVAVGWAVPDDLVEAIELPGKQFVLGVLWHPEVQEGSRVVGSFVEASKQRAATSRQATGARA